MSIIEEYEWFNSQVAEAIIAADVPGAIFVPHEWPRQYLLDMRNAPLKLKVKQVVKEEPLPLKWLPQAFNDFADNLGRLHSFELAERLLKRVARLSANKVKGIKGRIKGTREFVVAGIPIIVVFRIRDSIVQVLRIVNERDMSPIIY